jgi:hypothetical protein
VHASGESFPTHDVSAAGYIPTPVDGALFWRTDFRAHYYYDRATSAWVLADRTPVFSKAGNILSPSGAVDAIIWRAQFACTVTAVRGYRVGGTGATINARRAGVDQHLASDLSLAAADEWTDGGAVQNTAYTAGQAMEIQIVTVAGAPDQVAVQVEFTQP